MSAHARPVSVGIPKSSLHSTPSFLEPLYSVHHELCFAQSFFSKIQCAYVAWFHPPHAHARSTRARISPPRTCGAQYPACPAAPSHSSHDKFRLRVLAADFRHDGGTLLFVPDVHAANIRFFATPCHVFYLLSFTRLSPPFPTPSRRALPLPSRRRSHLLLSNH